MLLTYDLDFSNQLTPGEGKKPDLQPFSVKKTV